MKHLNLTALIQSLNIEEKKAFKKYYRSLKGEKAGKSLQLFNLINSVKAHSDREASLLLYGKENKLPAFSNIKKRLYREILNFLFTLEESELIINSNIDKAVRCQKYISVAEIFVARAKYQLSNDILNEALKIADKFELVYERIRIRELLALCHGYLYGEKAYNEHTKDIEMDLLLLKEKYIANKEFMQIQFVARHLKNKEFVLKEKVKNALNVINGLNNRHLSPMIQYRYLSLKTMLHQLEGELNEAIDNVRLSNELVKNEPSLNCNIFLANTQLQMANLNLQADKFYDAYSNAMQSLPYLSPEGSNSLLALEKAFLPLVHLKDVNRMKTVLDLALKHPIVIRNPNEHDKWNLYHAYYHFLSGEHSISGQLLNKASAILKDSSGWFTGYKLLEIYNLYAMNEKDLLESKIFAFEKLISRIGAKINARRFELIAKILLYWNKVDYDFEKTYLSNRQFFDQLSNAKPQENSTIHLPLTSEVISFTEWFAMNRELKTISKDCIK